MSNRTRMSRLSTLLLAWVTLISCSRSPVPVLPLKSDPDAAGKRAIEAYDTDGDGKISIVELAKSPPLLYALENEEISR